MSEEWKTIENDRIHSGIDECIIKLDHIAYRVKKGERLTKMGELMNLVPYKFFKNFKVISANANTTCLKLKDTLPVVVISEGLNDESVVEKYCRKFGSRIHHLAYLVNDIETVVKIQKERGIEFTTDNIIGSVEEGIKQIFTMPTVTTNHIIEYIQRFGDFDGFFTPTNVADLMLSTEKLGEA